MEQTINVSVRTNGTPAAQYKTVILKPNVIDGVNTLTQIMMSQPNTKYVIKYDYTLGEDITIPANCVLEFDGGSISGAYTVTFDNTYLNGKINFYNCYTAGVIRNAIIYSSWFKGEKKLERFINLVSTSPKTLVLEDIYTLTVKDSVLNNGTKIIGKTQNCGIVFNLSENAPAFITRQNNTPTYAGILERDYFTNSCIEISNLTIKVNTGYIYIRDCIGVKISNIIFNTDNVLVNEYPKAILINGCKDVEIIGCSSNKVPIVRTELSYNVNCCNNIGKNITSTFIEICSGFKGKMANNYVDYVGSTSLSLIASNACDIFVDNNELHSTNNIGYGITVGHESNDMIAKSNYVTNNNIYGAKYGINVQNAKSLTIENNHVEDNEKCLNFLNGSCDKVYIRENYFKTISGTFTTPYGDDINVIDYIELNNNNIILNGTYQEGILRLRVSDNSGEIVVYNNSISSNDFKNISIIGPTLEIKNNRFNYIQNTLISNNKIDFSYNIITGYNSIFIRAINNVDSTIRLNVINNDFIAQSNRDRVMSITYYVTPSEGSLFYDNDLKNRPLKIYIESSASEELASSLNSKRGTSDNRPTYMIFDGFEYFDTTIGKPIWSKKVSGEFIWVDATGTPV